LIYSQRLPQTYYSRMRHPTKSIEDGIDDKDGTVEGTNNGIKDKDETAEGTNGPDDKVKSISYSFLNVRYPGE
jgi:hypothetical protein